MSGDGDHMYVDCIPRSAGKLSSLVHVQKKYRIPLERTIACGDSGESIIEVVNRAAHLLISYVPLARE